MPKIINRTEERVHIDNIEPHPANPNDGDVAAIAESIRQNGFYGRIVVRDSTGKILAGEHRWRAAQEVGLGEVPIERVECDDETAMRILLADNRTAEKAEREPEPLADLLESLEATDDGLAGTGYENDDLNELLDDLGRNGHEDVDDPGAETSRAEELQEEWSTERGQLWQVGRHRLLCGDATEEGDVERLLEGNADVCFTSPPYALGDSVSLSNNTHIDDNPYNEHEDSAESWRPLIEGFFNASDALVDLYAVNLSVLAGCKAEMLDWVGGLSDRVHDVAIWSKPNPAPAMAEGVLARADEWIIFVGDEGASRSIPFSSWRGEVQSVYEGAGNYGNDYSDVHAATMPVHVAEWMMAEVCDTAQDWYEPFAGTGTTIIAAEQEGRTCYAMEIDPAYCAVILERCSEAGMECELID